MKRTCKYVRGSVWYMIDTKCFNKYEADDHVQHGNRPVVIFSSDDGNATSNIVSVVPLTHVKRKLSINTVVKNPEGKISYALCNMLQPVDKKNLIDFQYIVSDDVMYEIERCVLLANGMERYIKSLDLSCTFDQLKSMIEGIVSNRVNEILKERTEPQIVTTDSIKNIIDSLLPGDSKIKTPIIAEPSLDSETKKVTKVKRVWDEPTCKAFLHDYDSCTADVVSERWNLSKRSVYSTASRCKKILKSMYAVK